MGVEGTGSYGAGLARHLATAGVRVVEVDRADRADRHRQGKSDPLDAVSAARAALSGRARGRPKGRDGTVEAIRALMVAKRSARRERTQTINQARGLIFTAPDDIRARFAKHSTVALVSDMAALRPRSGDAVSYCTKMALRELGRRAEFLDEQIDRLNELLSPLVAVAAPSLLALYGVGTPTPPRCCSSVPATTPNACAARPPGRSCAAPLPSPRRPAKPPAASASTPAVTAKPTTPYGGS